MLILYIREVGISKNIKKKENKTPNKFIFLTAPAKKKNK